MITKEQRRLYRMKIEQFMSRLEARILSDYRTLDAQHAVSTDPVAFANRLDMDYTSIEEGDKWGKEWESAWFHLTGSIPTDWAGKEVVAHLCFNGEALVFSQEGTPLQGLTNGSVFGNVTRHTFILEKSATGGEAVDLWIEAAANCLGGVSRPKDPPRNSPGRHGSYPGIANKMRIAVMKRDLYDLHIDMEVLINLMKALDEDSMRAVRIMRGLSDAVNLFADDEANAGAARELLKPLLDKPANATVPQVNAVGHAHIDTGWLWPVRETIRKSARTFSSQIDLIERYPGYVFGASQPQHYQMVKENYPGLYEKIKKAVADGTWEPQGGMWVEADCNVISGESMVRQILHGKNFFMDEFGFDVKNCWIPDVFGYSAAMPQLLKRAGVDYFLTQKLSWSQFNKFPHTTFRWRGIDGTEVLTHFPPENTYNSRMNPDRLIQGEKNFKEKEVLDEMMSLFGIGDGGGGPTAEHIEYGLRQADLEGVPHVRFGRADDFFERIKPYTDQMPVWSGELYLEVHRATYTTQARTKRGNRFLEQKLRETEYLLSLGSMAGYPQEQLDRIWKTLLINQFHDILPGSSIHTVYETAEQQYAECLAECQELQQTAASTLFDEDADSLVVVNSLSVPFDSPIALPEGWTDGLVDASGKVVPVQVESDGTVVANVLIPAQGIATLKRGRTAATGAGQGLVLENDLIRYELNEKGEIMSAFDKQVGAEVLAGENANVLTLYEDRPHNWDAWDIDISYEDMAMETATAVSHTRLADGPVRQGIAFELTIGQSTIKQKVYLGTNSKRLDFVTEVDWNECHRMLRTAFPVNVRSDNASFDIQYGYAKRPTHRNTSWDMARFEVAAQKYVDLSNNDHGVALLNDCKYGHKILDNVIDLNLLRAPTHPDPDADLGHHEFTYSLLPHIGTLIESSVMDEAAQLNQAPIIIAGRKAEGVHAPVTITGDGVTLEVLKKAEKDDSLVIRVVERRGCAATATINVANGKSVVETDLMEWNDGDTLGCGTVEVEMRPFDILTFKIK